MTDKPKILIVDDRVENLVVLEKILAPLEAELIRATSGNQALALTLEHDFALALLDVQMPNMDGYETVTLMRQDSRTEFLPVIFLSAVYSGQYHEIKGIEVGAVDFIEKPLNPELLLGKVRNFLELYRNRKMLEEFNLELEKQVSERTIELEAVNDSLLKEIQERKLMEEELQKHRDNLESMVKERTHNLNIMIKSMTGRELRMVELKDTIKKLRNQLEEAGMTPVADDPIKGNHD